MGLYPTLALAGVVCLRPIEFHPDGALGCAALLLLIAVSPGVDAFAHFMRRCGPLAVCLVPLLGIDLLVSVEPHATLLLLARWVAVLILGLAVWVSVGRVGKSLLAWWTAGIGSAAALFALWQGLFGFRAQAERLAAQHGPLAGAALARLTSGRIFGTFLLPASLGAALGITIPLTLALAIRAKSARARALLAALAALQGVAAIWSLSVGAWAASACACAIVVAPRVLKSRRGRMALLGGLVLTIGLVAGALFARRELLPQPGPADRPLAYRLGNWLVALEMIGDSPVLGTGLGTFGDVYPAYRREGMNESRYAHCSWLQLVAELGAGAWPLLGLVLIGAVFIVRAGPAAGAIETGATIGVLSFLIHNTVDFTLYQPSVCALFAIALVLAVAHDPDRAPSRKPVVLPTAESAPSGGASAGASALAGHPDVTPIGVPGRRGIAPRILATGAALILGFAALSDIETEKAIVAHGRDAVLEEHALRRAVGFDPLNADAHGNLARFLAASPVGSENLEVALSEAQRAIDLDPRTAYRRRDLAWIELKCGRAADAWVALSRAAALHPHKAEYRTDLESVEPRLFGAAANP